MPRLSRFARPSPTSRPSLPVRATTTFPTIAAASSPTSTTAACRPSHPVSAVAPGQPNSVFDGTDLALDCHAKLRSDPKKGGFTDVYTRLDPDKPAPTMTTKCFSVSNGRYGHYDTDQIRAISVREAAALQSFPDDYKFYGSSIGQTARMVGNAVPPKLATFFARYMMQISAPFGSKDLKDSNRSAA